MFSFHKPKIYRSNLGCCICKAKSSSSRFTDSKKYENEFERCFRIQEKRSGEICNACVLLVKRWKKLSPDNRLTKHWHHVVDARAGPGTKITGNRRITGVSSSHNSYHQSLHDSSSSSSTSSSSATLGGGRSNKSAGGGKAEVLPLSSSQANNQASSSGMGPRGRVSSLSKARAIDTNVSTFTFGEPPSSFKRNYLNGEQNSSCMSSYSSTSSPLTKPQSALNSSAFESVIKRFRQRQQQQQLESQRRQLNRMERQKLRQSHRTTATAGANGGQAASKKSPLPQSSSSSSSTTDQSGNKPTLDSPPSDPSSAFLAPPTKRVKRNSEYYGSLSGLEALKISTVLDSTFWRREKICCGILFRGLFNEVAIVPKLLKPCDHKLIKLAARDEECPSGNTSSELADEETKDLIKKADEPPPRTSKSGSISSCDSSTSGTGSVEPTLEEIKRNNRDQKDPSPAVRPRSVPTKRRRPQQQQQQQRLQQQQRQQQQQQQQPQRQQKQNEDVESTSTSGASTLSSGGKVDSPSGSDNSSRMMILVDGCELMEEEEDELVMAEDEEEVDDEECEESSNDASSSAESLVEMDTKKSSAVA